MFLNNINFGKTLDIQINNKPIEAIGEIKLKRFMRNSPSTLDITFRKSDLSNVELGQEITLKYNNNKAFKGYIFSIKENASDLVTVLAYDQLRYLKNHHTLLVKNKTVSQLLKDLCGYFKLKIGEIEDTKVDIAVKQQIIENKAVFEIIYDGIMDTMIEEKKKNNRILTYILYDDFGKITLKNSEKLTTNIFLDETNIIDYSNDLTIDGETYNKILIAYKDDDKHELNTFYFDSSDTQKKWGVLQKVENHKNITKAQAEKLAKDLLTLYNTHNRSLKVKTLNTDINVRGGTKVPVILNTVDKQVKRFYLIKTVTHIFTNDEYLMELELLGVG